MQVRLLLGDPITNAVCYWAGVSDAEKAHDITGVYDETL